MQKFNNPCIKTGDFAKLCKTNKRTLFHYDAIGLFSPAYTDEKGYRYYSERQADVFFTITCLKELGMPLKEIRAYIDGRNPTALKKLLLEQSRKVDEEILHLARIRQVINTKLSLLETGAHLTFDGRISPVYDTEIEEEYLITSPAIDTDDHEEIFHALCRHIAYCNEQNLNAGYPYGAMLSVRNILHGNTDTYSFFLTKVAEPPVHTDFFTKPGGRYAAVYLKGDYYDAQKAYDALFSYMEKNRLSPGEYLYKEAVIDELAVESEQDFVTKISLAVTAEEKQSYENTDRQNPRPDFR